MGIFDKLTGSKKVQFTPKLALTTAAITVIAADGVLDDQEIFDLNRIVHGDRNVIDSAVTVVRESKLPEVIDLVAGALDEKQRFTTMAILLDLAMSDGILSGEEQTLLKSYMEKFGITEAALKPIIDAIAVKNDFSIFS
jgi:uncharacterized tellurite resistance protein B-like protein